MSKRLLYQFLIINILTAVMAAVFYFNDLPGANVLFLVSVVMQFMFAIPALMEIHKSKNIDMTEKLAWTIGLILSTSLTGLFYLAFRRNVVLGKK
ncbi:MAG: hypothetical protein R2800_04645 [Flavipsychrobacter sp.]